MLPAALSATAGAVDVIGFLALGGLFAAHITGDLVVLAAHFTVGAFSKIGPLLALPVFVAVVGTVARLVRSCDRARSELLVAQAALLTAAFALSAVIGPVVNPDSRMAVLVGMLLVAAMAIQNALVKITLPGDPATAVMTMNLTQLAIDLAVGAGQLDSVERAKTWRRVGSFAPCVAGFAAGCCAGALIEFRLGLCALALPALLALLAVPLGSSRGCLTMKTEAGTWSRASFLGASPPHHAINESMNLTIVFQGT